MTMREVLVYQREVKKLRGEQNRLRIISSGVCSGLTNSEYNKVIIRQKSVFRKGKSFASTRLWSYNSNQIKLNK